jgi:predicted DCC family thiol-disulfide oxidoreductase YuxK
MVGVVNSENSIIFYDGVCGLCNRLVQFVLKKDCLYHFQFAALQSDLAHRLLEPYHFDLSELSTVYVIVNPGSPNEKLFAQSDAAIVILARLRGIWRIASFVLATFPRPLRDLVYRYIARHRYRIFGRHEACRLPDPKDAHRFLR